MKVLEIYATNLPGNRTALKTDAKYTPYVICSNYNPKGKENQQWASAYGYYETFERMCIGVVELQGCTIIDDDVVDRLSEAVDEVEDEFYEYSDDLQSDDGFCEAIGKVRNIIKEEMSYGD